MDEAEAAGSEMGRVATIIDINMQSVKKMTSGTLLWLSRPREMVKLWCEKPTPTRLICTA
jgi:hypothetical protein